MEYSFWSSGLVKGSAQGLIWHFVKLSLLGMILLMNIPSHQNKLQLCPGFARMNWSKHLREWVKRKPGYKKGLKIIKSKVPYIYSTTTQTRTLWWRLPNHKDFWKQIILKVSGKRTNNIHRFEGCFLRGQVSSKGFKVFNECIVEYLNFNGPFAKKLENLLFSEMIVIGQSSSECPGLSSHTITTLKIRSATHLITKVSNIMHTQINGWPSKVTLKKKNRLMFRDRNN